MQGNSLARPFAAVAVLVLLAGCGSDPVGPRDPEDLNYAASLGVDLSEMTQTADGLYYEILTPGQGTDVVEEGDELAVDYTGWLHNGQRFDGGTYEFTIGGDDPSDQVINGWFLGLQGMRLGETRLLVVPHWLGYGDRRAGEIPKYSTLVFEVTIDSLIKGD